MPLVLLTRINMQHPDIPDELLDIGRRISLLLDRQFMHFQEMLTIVLELNGSAESHAVVSAAIG